MLTITLDQIRAHSPCTEGWRKLLAYLDKNEADDEPFPLEIVLESNGFDALWCLRCFNDLEGPIRLLAVRFAREVEYLMLDERSRNALDVAERFAKGTATLEELKIAADAAYSASIAAAYAATAHSAAAYDAVADVYYAAAYSAAYGATVAAAHDVYDAVYDAAAYADRSRQTEIFRDFCREFSNWSTKNDYLC